MLADHLGQCAYCGGAVFRLNLYSGPAGLTDINWQPWTIEDEVPPTHDNKDKPMTKATLKRWEEERPYRLGLVVIDLQSGTYQAATNKPRGRLRSSVMHKLHMCKEKEERLYGIRETSIVASADHHANQQ